MSKWSNNIELLAKKNIYLAEKLKNYKSKDVILHTSKSGAITASYKGIFINSTYDPIKEAKSRVTSIEDIHNSTMVINLGLGLGYEVNEMIDQLGELAVIIIVIADLDIFKTVVEEIDLTKVLSFERLALLDGTEKDFKAHFSKVSMKLLYSTARVTFYIHPVIGKMKKEIIEKSITDIKDALLKDVMDVGNSVEDSIIGLEHTLQNLKHIIKSPDLSKLKGRFSGIPAICVAAGPSLEKNLHILKEAQGKAAIFAAETIMDRLRAEEIKFNFAAAIERPEYLYEMDFKGKPVEKDVVFLGDSVVYHKIFDENESKNVVIFNNMTYVEMAFSSKINNMNALYIGYSAASVNMAVANYLGFSPIILVGQDLAYGDEGSDHAKGTIYYDPEYQPQFSEKVPILHDDIYLKDINGKAVKSTVVWKLIKDGIEVIIKNTDTPFINATEGGAYIEGTSNMALKEAINLYCRNQININFADEFLEPSENEKKERIELLNEEIKKQIEDTRQVKELCASAKLVMEKFIKGQVLEKADSNHGIKDYFNIINITIRELEKKPMPAFIMQALIYNILRNNNSLLDIENIEVSREWYERNCEFFHTSEKISQMLLDIYYKNRFE